MIIDLLKNNSLYSNILFVDAFNFLKKKDLLILEVGDYKINGDMVFAKVREYDTKDRNKAKWEAHKKYIDLHYIVSGTEHIGYAITNEMQNISYIEEKDQMVLDGTGDFFKLKEGYFSIFYPYEAHMPAVFFDKSEYVKKIIIKIKT